ncbi:MAG: hypothetical protein ACREQY_24935, partial [Candidatus Binatia bacterium]
VLLEGEAGKRSLADFGNFIGRSARTVRFARVSVWDDEEAWRRSLSAEPTEEVLSHKRAEYLKDSEPAPVEEFTVFSPSGEVIYERDFRDYPLTDTDER